MPTKAEKEVYAKLTRLGCILCRQHGINTTDTPTEIHHIRRFGGKRSLAPAIGLCAYHHRLGDNSYHSLGAKGFTKYWGISPEELLKKTNDLLQETS
ncbi:Recombination enhancement, RecA-dependent nuclease [uncultured Caudovirales phage]|uniref:Recombination enhancement, RecA-dependent nuclease n=1 Tax=uncultured Caudovirales phage TaxID=2100421 RepID=A0A6J7WEB3_9CAUD|nr:Recombination enhancement, RecA-dependent nuclease [uncultured Caudovirales phage]